ncbi:MAG: hypothetical protein LBV12_13170 [Puniceicoccales bacterium]|jgi:hypothetical protein|nr:hypothetical protein [Puniceicoccales bacterium]
MAKKLNPLFYAFAIPMVGIGFAAGIILARNSGKFGDLKPFRYESYQQDWRTLQGNEYIIRGQVDQQLAYLENKGRILAVKLLDGSGRVPVFIPKSIQQNFETGQRYKMHVLVRKDVLYVEDVEKF